MIFQPQTTLPGPADWPTLTDLLPTSRWSWPGARGSSLALFDNDVRQEEPSSTVGEGGLRGAGPKTE